MAKKAELYAELKKLDKKTKLTERNTIKEIQAALDAAKQVATAGNSKQEAVSSEKGSQEVAESQEPKSNIGYAKSGKRSLKHEEEVKEKSEKEARKVAGGAGEVAEKKGAAPRKRSILERRGKNYRKVAEKVDKSKLYSLNEAVKLATETCPVKFDSTLEIHVRLGVDPKQADQNIRSTIVLPHGSGKTVRVAAFATEADDLKKAGADIAGEEEVLALLDKEKLDFDVLVTTPQLMPKLGKYARILGPRGLMPNPKSGTVSTNPAQAVREAKSGKVEYRVDAQGIVHLAVGKVSFGAEKLEDNAKAFLDSLNANKPTSLKGNFILSISVSTTMGPGIRVSL